MENQEPKPPEPVASGDPLQSPPVELPATPLAAVAAAGEALTEVKAAEVAALADVLTKLQAEIATCQSLGQQLTSLTSDIQVIKAELQMALAEVQVEKDRLKEPQQVPSSESRQQRTGLRSLLP